MKKSMSIKNKMFLKNGVPNFKGGNRMGKKRCLLLLTTLFLVLESVACKSNQVSSQEVVWRVMIPSGFWEEDLDLLEENWEEEINRILEKEKKAYQVDVKFVYDMQDIDGMSGVKQLEKLSQEKEVTDVISVMSNTVSVGSGEFKIDMPYMTCVTNDILLPLDQWLSSDSAVELKKAVPQADLENAKVDGITYGISAVQPQVDSIAYSVEVLDQCGISKDDLSVNIFENEDILLKVKEMTGKIPYMIYSSADAYNYLGNWRFFHPEVLQYDLNGQFVNVMETEEYLNIMKRFYDWKKKGLLDTSFDKTTEDSDEAFAVPASFLEIENFRLDCYDITIERNGTEQSYYVVPNPDMPILNPYWGDYKVGIASWSKNQDNAFDFINELMTNKEISNYIQYGTDGQDFQLDKKENVNINKVMDMPSIFRNYFGYQYANSLITQATLTMSQQDKMMYANEFHETYEQNLPRGFRFNPNSCIEEITKVDLLCSEYKDGAVQMKNDVYRDLLTLECANLDETISCYCQQLRDAGIDDIVEEANRQLEEWRELQ